MKNNRVKTVYINTVVTLAGQFLQMLLGFILRKVFILYIGVTYLGYNSVFQNILQALNLADLGLSVAITSFLYRPLAEHDETKIASLMFIYKKIYSFCGIIVLAIGIFLSFFLKVLIPDATCDMSYLRLLYYINLGQTVSTYYLAYKRTLIIADQKSYEATIIDSFFNILITIVQIITMIFIPNYIVYLLLSVGKNIFSNILVSYRCDKKYRSLENNIDLEYIDEIKPQIFRYMKDLFISRLGAYVYYSTDNIIISMFRGSLLTGYFSNYTMITAQISNIINQVLASIQATFGNYIVVTNDKKEQKKMTDNYLCLNYCIGNFCMLCILFLIQPFIELYLGREYLLAESTAFWLSINLLLTVMIQVPSQVFMIYKLYKYDKPIIVISASLNIFISVGLVQRMGVDGVLIGTVVTSCFYLFSRFYIISKYVYDINFSVYVITFLKYAFFTIMSVIVEFVICYHMDDLSFPFFCIRVVIVGISALLMTIFIIGATKEFEFVMEKFVPKCIKKYISKKLCILLPLLLVLIIMLLCNIFI